MMPGPEPPAEMSLTVLGSSSGVPDPERSCSGYLFRLGDRLSLIDCGSGVTSAFVKYGFDPEKVDRIFISHTHADHVTDLPFFIQMIHQTRRPNRLDLYLPEEFVVPFQIILRALYLIPERFAFDLHVNGYGEGTVYRGAFTLTAVANSHLEKIRETVERLQLPNRMQSFSFLLEAQEKKLFYSADVGSTDEIIRHIDGCDYVLAELTHPDPEAFISMAAKRKVGRFVVTHIADRRTADEIRQKALAAGLTNLVVAEDGMELSLQAP